METPDLKSAATLLTRYCTIQNFSGLSIHWFGTKGYKIVGGRKKEDKRVSTPVPGAIGNFRFFSDH